jgi:hypothetical protein
MKLFDTRTDGLAGETVYIHSTSNFSAAKKTHIPELPTHYKDISRQQHGTPVSELPCIDCPVRHSSSDNSQSRQDGIVKQDLSSGDKAAYLSSLPE